LNPGALALQMTNRETSTWAPTDEKKTKKKKKKKEG